MNANETIKQLGGNRIFAMVFKPGSAIAGPNHLNLRIAPALVKGTKGKATHVTIALDATTDTYTVTTSRVVKYDVTEVGSISTVYGDQLVAVVESMTGHRLSL